MRTEAKEGNARNLKQNKPNADAEMQQTVQNEGTISGQGLMFGESVELTLLPAPANFGVVFRRTDLPDMPEIRVCPENYGTVVPRCTSVQEGNAVVNSVEHILSALAGFGIDNVQVDISASEPPALDGSALLYADLIKKAGIVQQEVPRRSIEFEQPFAINEADRQIVLLPPIHSSSPLSTTIHRFQCKLALLRLTLKRMRGRLLRRAVFVSRTKSTC